jgi:ParB-like chromosome segregation protein Spo0J
MKDSTKQALRIVLTDLETLPEGERVDALNEIRRSLHEVSPFREEPVDLVLWISQKCVKANGYNPNSVAPPEMELLKHSIQSDGYTQPIVGFAFSESEFEVVDGFHRNRVGREDAEVSARVKGYLPVVNINEGRKAVSDRMASTIRHNRARGKHQVVKMSDIVIDLTRRGWTDEKIAVELGMDADEVLRLKQITGLADLFSDREFSSAWEIVAAPEETRIDERV